MPKVKMAVTLRSIQKIVPQIVEYFRPQKVILFGSYAYGVSTVDSDVDLLVMMDTEEKPIHVAARIAATIDHPFLWTLSYSRPPTGMLPWREKGFLPQR